MTLIAPAASPTVAVARALKRTGLEQGKGKDFQVTGRYRDGERKFTYVRVYGNQAAAVIAERADDIERWTSDAGFPFKVSVRYIGRHTLLVDVTNGPGERVREVPPAAEAPAVEEPAEPAAPAPAAAEEPAAEPEPAVSYAEDYRQEQQAKALGWSTRHAEVVRWAAAGELRMETPEDLRRITIPGRAGRRVAAALLRPLAAAAFVTLGELDEEGRHRVELTADGRRALEVWDRKSPTPAVLGRKQEGGVTLRPLLDGEEHRRRIAEFEADLKRRAAEREAWYAAFDLRRAAEEREDRLRAVWAEVEGVFNPFARRPSGWTPTPEQVEEFRIRPELVAELEEEAARVAAEAAAGPEEAAGTAAPLQAAREGVEASAAPVPGRAPELPAACARTAPAAAPRHPSLGLLTLQSHCVSIEVSGRPTAQRAEEKPRHDHDPHPQHRGRRRHHRRTRREGDRGRRPRGTRPGDGRRPHDRGPLPGRHPALLHPQPRQGDGREGRRDRHRSGRHRRLLQLGQHPHPPGRLTAPAGRPGWGARAPPSPDHHRARRHHMSRTVQTLSLRHLGLTLLLVRMTATQVKAWSWVGDMWDGTTPVEGYEVRDTTGGLLGVILPLGHQAARLHAEWYDPASGDFYAAGETPAAVLTQGASYVLQQYAWHVGAVPPGEGFTLGGSRYHHRPGRCPFGYCFDLECVDHASVCAPAASAA